MAELDLLQPGRRFGGGRFVLIRILGRGGMGVVWLARDERLEEQVALKFLPPEIRENPPTLEHLRLETARSHRLTHPNIVRLHDFHEPPGEPAFISMEYVDGASLHALRVERPHGVLSWEYVRKLLPQLCEALEYAHDEHVIHRDLKPDNILIDSRGRAKLTDFGLAAMASDLARSGSIQGGGTLHFMSPQQLEGKHPEATDDIYALGATLYDLLTGQPPFHEGDLPQKILHESPEPLRERMPGLGVENEVPSDAAAMIMSCLAKEPEQRPQSARAVADWLEQNNVAPFAKPSPRVEHILPNPNRGKILWTVGALMCVLLLIEVGFWKSRHQHPAVAVPAGKMLSDQRWTNSLGMIFVPVPNCAPLFCIWKTRVQDYQVMANETGRPWEKPSFSQTPQDPAVNIKWKDAHEFCGWLTRRERASGIIAADAGYRLPTDEEWSLAVSLDREPGNTPQEKDGKVQGVYPWGSQWPPPHGSGNFDPKVGADDFPYTSPVGTFSPNLYGLYDMAGNAREWCEDYSAPGSKWHVVRGSSWFDTPQRTLESSRRALTPAQRGDNRYDYFGFRCVLVTNLAEAVADLSTTADPPDPSNALSKEEIAAGWKLLFDGQTTAGWRGYKMDGFPRRGWHIADDCLVNPKSNGRPNGSGGDLITVEKFLNFEFSFEWRISKGGNSGVQYFFDENRPKTPVPMYSGDTGNSPMGFEYQILDDPNYPRELKNGPKHLTAALYLLIAPTNKVLQPAGEFNEGRIVVNGNHVEQWLNGSRVVECELGSSSLMQAIADTKFKWIHGLGTKFATQIALQDHGDEVAFRNLKIRELKP